MKKVLLKGPLLTQSGYGHHARTVLRALRKREDVFDIYLQALSWGQTGWLWEDTEERRWIDEILQKTLTFVSEGGEFDISLQVTIPNEWERIAPINIGITAGIETTKVSPQWIEKSHMVDKIITISEHAKTSYKDTVYKTKHPQTEEMLEFQCAAPIEVVSYPVRKFKPKKIDLNLTTDFNFLSVVQISPRKNVDQLLKCFIEQFRDEENVGLVLKVNMAKNSLIDREATTRTIKQKLLEYGDKKCKVYVLHGFLTDEEMAGLYTHPKIKCMVSTAHGEGFGLPLFESAYYGLPIAATDWSGHLDFLYKMTKQKNGKEKKKHMFSKISYTLAPVQKEAVWDGVLQSDSMWAYPEEGSVKMALEDVYKDYGRFKKRAGELQKWVCKEFEADKQYKQYTDILEQFFPDEESDQYAFFEKNNG